MPPLERRPLYANEAEFRTALSLLLGSERLRRRLGENGRRFYEENYSWDVIEGKYLETVRRLGGEA